MIGFNDFYLCDWNGYVGDKLVLFYLVFNWFKLVVRCVIENGVRFVLDEMIWKGFFILLWYWLFW